MSTKTQSDLALSIAPSISNEELLERARDLQERIASVKPLYAEHEAVVLELVRRGWRESALANSIEARLVDNFVDAKSGLPRNTVFRPAGVKRFELDFTDPLSARRKKERV